jgi:hypothetical protein
MSIKNFELALEKAKNCKFYRTTGGENDTLIKKSESILKIKFSKQIYDFYSKLGYLSFYGHEIYGIDPNDTSGILEGNSVAYALNDRDKYGLPNEWLPIYSFDDGYMAYLDYSQLNCSGEPPVIKAIYNGKEYINSEKVAEDFGDFLLGLVEEQLTNQ